MATDKDIEAVMGAGYAGDFAEIHADVEKLRKKIRGMGYQLGLDFNNDYRLVLLPKGFDCSNASCRAVGSAVGPAANMGDFVNGLPDLVTGDDIYGLNYGDTETCWRVEPQ